MGQQSVRGNYKSFKGTNLTVVAGMHQFVMYQVYPVSRTTGEERAECSKGCRIYIENGIAFETSFHWVAFSDRLDATQVSPHMLRRPVLYCCCWY